MAPATFESIAERKAHLIRKGNKGAVLVGKYATAPLITTLVAASGQIEMPTTYNSVGWMSEDGSTKTQNRTLSQIRGWGSTSFLRQDITGDEKSLQFTMIEDRKVARELYEGIDLDAAEVSTEGELKYEIPDRPDIMYWRVCELVSDLSGDNLIYLATVYHKTSVGETGDLVQANGDNPTSRQVTMGAVPDDVTGTLGTNFIFGPGALKYAEDMGYTVESGGA
ncbi:hypothetical protein ACWEOE_28910 [Amycolatopsis sp. NPDC004368]